ncbi:MAG: HU family DNA-binding protein [Phycisphaerales bacterium]|nr:HU family DNA-binding protein [Phycisphaerales bacterium]
MAKRTAKRTAKTTTPKATAKKPTKIVSADKPRTKSEIYATLADSVGISKKDVAAVFDTMGAMIAADLKKGKAEQFTVPGMMKITVVRKPATKAREGINPFTKEKTIFKAKPARNVVKVRPMKGLKDMVS